LFVLVSCVKDVQTTYVATITCEWGRRLREPLHTGINNNGGRCEEKRTSAVQKARPRPGIEVKAGRKVM
jgi:hypothetical protein